jgi:hypothetical protein
MIKCLASVFQSLLKLTYPDKEQLVGELVEVKLRQKEDDFWLALKTINYEIGNDFDGGINGNNIAPEALVAKVRKLYRTYRLQKLRIERAAWNLQVPEEQLVVEIANLIKEVDEVNEVLDAVKPALKSVAASVKQVEKIEQIQQQAEVKK